MLRTVAPTKRASATASIATCACNWPNDLSTLLNELSSLLDASRVAAALTCCASARAAMDAVNRGVLAYSSVG